MLRNMGALVQRFSLMFWGGEPSTTYSHVGWGCSLAAALSIFLCAAGPEAGAVCWVLWAGFVGAFCLGIGNSQQLSASVGSCQPQASVSRRSSGAVLAPNLHFLPSLCSLLEKLWQLPPFPSSPQLLLPAPSSPPSLCFLCRNQIPHCPNCCCLFPCYAGGALSLSPSYRALCFCSPFPNVHLFHLFPSAFAFCRESVMCLCPRSFFSLPLCLPLCSCL